MQASYRTSPNRTDYTARRWPSQIALVRPARWGRHMYSQRVAPLPATATHAHLPVMALLKIRQHLFQHRRQALLLVVRRHHDRQRLRRLAEDGRRRDLLFRRRRSGQTPFLHQRVPLPTFIANTSLPAQAQVVAREVLALSMSSTRGLWQTTLLACMPVHQLTFLRELGSSKWCSAGCWTLFASKSSSHAHSRRTMYVSKDTCKRCAVSAHDALCSGLAWSAAGNVTPRWHAEGVLWCVARLPELAPGIHRPGGEHPCLFCSSGTQEHGLQGRIKRMWTATTALQ